MNYYHNTGIGQLGLPAGGFPASEVIARVGPTSEILVQGTPPKRPLLEIPGFLVILPEVTGETSKEVFGFPVGTRGAIKFPGVSPYLFGDTELYVGLAVLGVGLFWLLRRD